MGWHPGSPFSCFFTSNLVKPSRQAPEKAPLRAHCAYSVQPQYVNNGKRHGAYNSSTAAITVASYTPIHTASGNRYYLPYNNQAVVQQASSGTTRRRVRVPGHGPGVTDTEVISGSNFVLTTRASTCIVFAAGSILAAAGKSFHAVALSHCCPAGLSL